MSVKNKIYILSIALLFVSNFGALYLAQKFAATNPLVTGFYIVLGIMFIQLAFSVGLFRVIEKNNIELREQIELNHLLIKEELSQIKNGFKQRVI